MLVGSVLLSVSQTGLCSRHGDKGLPSSLYLPWVVHRRVGTLPVLRLYWLWVACLSWLPSGPPPLLPLGRCSSHARVPSVEATGKGSSPYRLMDLCAPGSPLVLSTTTGRSQALSWQVDRGPGACTVLISLSGSSLWFPSAPPKLVHLGTLLFHLSRQMSAGEGEVVLVNLSWRWSGCPLMCWSGCPPPAWKKRLQKLLPVLV